MSSWLKSAVNRAMEARARNPLATLNIRPPRIPLVNRSITITNDKLDNKVVVNNLSMAKRLEEAAVSSRGQQRLQLLRKWVAFLKGSGRTRENLVVGSDGTVVESTVVSSSDFDSEGDVKNFCDVFLHSQALESITMSMILEAPNDEEASLMLEIFGLCLTGDKEVHSAIMASLQQLAKSFASYQDEVLVKREELLQFAQGAISGVKLNTNLARIDDEASTLWKKIDGMEALGLSSNEGHRKTSANTAIATGETLNLALTEVQLCSRLEELLLQKKSINNGDSFRSHSEKVDKLKVLAESLANSSIKAEIRISDHRRQLEEALNFRVAKAGEISETEKVVASEIAGLEKQKEELEAELNKDKLDNKVVVNNLSMAKRLEEAAVSSRGQQRLQLLRKWVAFLKGSGRTRENLVVGSDGTVVESTVVSSSDFDSEGDVKNFCDVFLHSQALESITMSMILEAPNDEEASLMLEIFGLCLTGDKEVHSAIMASLQQLAKSFASYQDEVLVKREELLQFAQGAISGVKLNTNLARIDDEASTLWKKIDGMEALGLSSNEGHRKTSANTAIATGETLNLALTEVQLCSRLEELLLQKKSINNGDSFRSHSEKVDKLKVLAESLANSSIKAEIRISDHRRQLEEALNFRVAKAGEISETEKVVASEIAGLEKQKEELEAELNKVNISLKAARVRLNKHREERNHFDDANNQIIFHLKMKEDELSRSIASCKVEADIVHLWIKFLEDTWVIQSSFTELKEKKTNDELKKYGSCFMKLIKYHLMACKEELRPFIHHIKTLVDSLKYLNERSGMMLTSDNDVSKEANLLKLRMGEYLEAERKIITAFSVVDHMKELIYTEEAHVSRRDDPEVNDLFDAIEKLRVEFGSVERPSLNVETLKDNVNSSERSAKSSSVSLRPIEPKPKRFDSPDSGSARRHPFDSPDSGSARRHPFESPDSGSARRHPDGKLSKFDVQFEDASSDWSSDDIVGWEFD